MDAKQVIEQFFPTRSSATITAYTKDLNSFLHYLEQESAQEALDLFFSLPESQANLIVLHYKSKLLQADHKPASVNRRLSTIRSIVKVAYQAGLVEWKLDIRNEQNIQECLVETPDKSKIQKLMRTAAAQQNPIKAARDYAMLCLMYDLALKRNCIACLNLNDLDISGRTLTLPTLSTHQNKIKRIPNRTYKSLLNWLEFRGQEQGPLFNNIDASGKNRTGITSTSIYRIMKSLGETAGIQITPEQIRKAAISEALQQSQFLGLSDHEVLAFSDHKCLQSLKNIKKHQSKVQLSLSERISRN